MKESSRISLSSITTLSFLYHERPSPLPPLHNDHKIVVNSGELFITKPRLFKYIKNFTTKNENFQIKNSGSFHISAQAQNIDCGYLLELPRRGGTNEYPQSMFLSRNKKNNVRPCKPQFYCIKVGLKGFKTIKAVFVMTTSFLSVEHPIRIPVFPRTNWQKELRHLVFLPILFFPPILMKQRLDIAPDRAPFNKKKKKKKKKKKHHHHENISI